MRQIPTPNNNWTFEDWLKIARYEGPVDARVDFDRLQGQTKAIHDLMIDGKFRTLAEIEGITGYPQPSISAQLRHLRKIRFGGFIDKHDPDSRNYKRADKS